MYSSFILIPVLLPFVTSFDCFTCNEGATDTPTRKCIDKKSTCPPGVESCSMLVYVTGGRKSVRKFCTQSSSPLNDYLQMLPGASMCQNIDLSPKSDRYRYNLEGQPSSPNFESASLLCICSTPLCNKGSYRKVMDASMLLSPALSYAPVKTEETKDWRSSTNDHPDADLDKQMADAGF